MAQFVDSYEWKQLMICQICGNPDKNRTLRVSEMMFGSGRVFTYLECGNCGGLQIVNPPSDLQNHYPPNYYSFQKVSPHGHRPRDLIVAALAKKKDSYALFKRGIVGRLIGTIREKDRLLDLMGNAQVKTNSRVLDVGCGAGGLLNRLLDQGFTDLIGIDPYATEHIGSGMRILSKKLEDLSEDDKFDLIIFNESFEHMPDQLAILRKASSLLSRNGVCLIRMPVKTEYIWNRYRTNWVQIDAPRHYAIHTLKSFDLLLKRTDLVLEETVFDSSILQFVGSEQYLRGIPLSSPESYDEDPQKSIFNAKQIRQFKKTTKQLNKTKQGDRAVFCLRKKSSALRGRTQ